MVLFFLFFMKSKFFACHSRHLQLIRGKQHDMKAFRFFRVNEIYAFNWILWPFNPLIQSSLSRSVLTSLTNNDFNGRNLMRISFDDKMASQRKSGARKIIAYSSVHTASEHMHTTINSKNCFHA